MPNKKGSEGDHSRRDALKLSGAVAAWGVLGALGLRGGEAAGMALTRTQRDRMTPEDVLTRMKQGNERFQQGKQTVLDPLDKQRASAAGQHPAAVLLACIDSRAPIEAILDLGIGDVFDCRVGGNVDNEDILGSMELACTLAGAKVVLVMGHTGCGAIKGAIENTELGNFTGLLGKIAPAVRATTFVGERSAQNHDFVNAVVKRNVELTLERIRQRSSVLAELENGRAIRIAGSMYDPETRAVEFFPTS